MCGITGILSKEKINKIDYRINKMVSCMKYRGPDNQSVKVLDDKVAFGHARLAIIDLDSKSNQPMISNDKNWIVVFNGEIFNFKEIKDELNYDFKTNGDTEVILASVASKSLNWFLERANGMFAISLYNIKEKKLYLVRDRFSIKPLYYTMQNNAFIFGSEIKCLLNSGLFEPKFNTDAIDEYLGNRMVREPFTFFKDIYQVCGGEYLEIDENLNIKTNKYYEIPRQNFDSQYDEEKLIKETKSKVEEAIKRWTISDVKLGAYLSGGVDSSLTSAIIASNNYDNKEKIHTYTIGFKDNNEFKYSKIVADKYNINHKDIIIDYNEYISKWDDLIEFNDAPLAVPNEIPLAIMSTELSKDITVVISGEGADELFGGYGKIYRLPFDYKNHDFKCSFYDAFINQYEYVPREVRDKYLLVSKKYRNYFDNKISNEFTNYTNEENVFRFFQTYHIKGLLKRVDMTTMQASVEARPPFLDHELIEYVNTKVPYNLKLKWIDQNNMSKATLEYSNQYSEVRDTPKYILKKVSEYYLPDEIIYRKKVGFPVPLTSWLDKLIEMAKYYLKNSDWFCSEKLDELIDDAKEKARSGQIIWMFINIEKFKRKYFNKKWKY